MGRVLTGKRFGPRFQMEDGMGRVLPRKQKLKFKYTTEPV